VEEVSERMESIETRDVVETGELERSLSPQEMICGGAMMCGTRWGKQAAPPLTVTSYVDHVIQLEVSIHPSHHNAFVTLHVSRDQKINYICLNIFGRHGITLLSLLKTQSS